MERKWVEVGASDQDNVDGIETILNRLMPYGLQDIQIVFCGNDRGGSGQFRILGTVASDVDINKPLGS